MGFDERTMEELSDREKALAQSMIYQTLGIDPERLDGFKAREYSSANIQICVYKTNKEGIFLQELNFEDGEKDGSLDLTKISDKVIIVPFKGM